MDAGLNEPEASANMNAIEPENSNEPVADVVMYCTTWCPGCRQARAYLQEHKIPYLEIDISRDRSAAQRVRGWANGNETTPTFNIRGQIVVDFDRPKLDELLGITHQP